ncbi:MAG: alkyl sulfatase dimerization domain-containing protein [Chitinophagales bacterium]
MKSTFRLYSCLLTLTLILVVGCGENASAPSNTLEVNADNTTQANLREQLEAYLPFEDSTDFVNAKRGFIATRKDPIIKNEDGSISVHLASWDFLDKPAPATANPSLWRQGQLNKIHGLFEVTKGIYQIRGFDLANMTLIESNNGWIIIDPLTSKTAAKAGLELANEHLGKKTVQAVIFTHSHIDHFGGIRGVVTDEDIKEGRVEIIAPEGFFEHSITENIIAGNAMMRRATIMFGSLLPRNEKGMIGNGLGQIVSRGQYGILKPTKVIKETGEKLVVDGIEIVFQNTPEAEAPAEFMFYFPQFKAFCQAEEINHNLHNMYTLRGAEVRNGLKWSKYIDESLQMFGDEVEVSFGSHHWPTWENAAIVDFWKKQRDTYKYIHDETLYLANNGYTMVEIAEKIQLPDELAKFFANRGYYGTVSHNSKAQYQLYFGWFDGNPANLHALPPVEASVKYVEYMGGADSILAKAQRDYDKGEYRWVGMVLNHLVFAEPQNRAARELLAKAYTQMGYQAESGPWRNFYLTGASELLNGITKEVYGKVGGASDDILTNMPLETFYDFLAVRMDRSKAKGKKYVFNIVFPDINQTISLYLENQVLHNRVGVLAENPNATVTMNKTTFNDIITQKSSGMKKYLLGEVKIEGNRDEYSDFQSMVETPFQLMFNIVEP